MRALSPTLILAGVAGFGWVVGSSVIRDFERRAAAEISAKLEGVGKRVRVTAKPSGLLGAAWGEFDSATIEASEFSTASLPLFTEPERSRRGQLGELRLQLKDFTLGTLEIERLEAVIPDCRFDLSLAQRSKQFRLSRSGIGSGTVLVDESALRRYILNKFKEIKSVDVKCDRGWIWIEGFGEFLFVATQFRVLAKLEPVEGHKVNLVRARVAFDGLPTEAGVAETVLQSLNPVIDLNLDLGLNGAIHLQEVVTENGKLRATGRATIPILPK